MTVKALGLESWGYGFGSRFWLELSTPSFIPLPFPLSFFLVSASHSHTHARTHVRTHTQARTHAPTHTHAQTHPLFPHPPTRSHGRCRVNFLWYRHHILAAAEKSDPYSTCRAGHGKTSLCQKKKKKRSRHLTVRATGKLPCVKKEEEKK